MADVLNPDALRHNLNRLGWDGTTSGIRKTYRFPTAEQATRFAAAVGEDAAHVDARGTVVVDADTVTVELCDPHAGGVTQADVDLAARIEGLSTA